MDALRQVVRDLPGPLRWAIVGAFALGLPGAVAGVVVGLHTYAPTAWAATAELGLPAAFAGAVLGVLLGWLALLYQRLRSH